MKMITVSNSAVRSLTRPPLCQDFWGIIRQDEYKTTLFCFRAVNSAAVLHPKVLYLLALSIQVWFRSNGITLNTSVSTSIKEQGWKVERAYLGTWGDVALHF